MPRKQKYNSIQCQYFIWRLFPRNGVWYADGRSGTDNLGKHSLGTRDKAEAEKALSQLDQVIALRRGLIKQEDVTTSLQGELSIAAGLQLFYADRGKAPLLGGATKSTLKRYRAVTDKFQEFCLQMGYKTWENVNRKNLEQYAGWLGHKHKNKRRSYAERTIAFEITVLRTINIFLCLEEHISKTARISIAIPKFHDSDRYCYRTEEVDKMLEVCFGQAALNWLGNLLATLATTGIRIGEAQQLRWSDIDFENSVIHIRDERSHTRKQLAGIARTTKGKRSRAIPMHPKLKNILKSMSRNQDGYVFHGPRGGRLKQNTVRNILIRRVIQPLKDQFPTVAGETGFEHGRLHSFRHFFVSECCRQGIPEARIMEWVGHRSSKILARYRHLRPEDGHDQMQGLNLLNGSHDPELLTTSAENLSEEISIPSIAGDCTALRTSAV